MIVAIFARNILNLSIPVIGILLIGSLIALFSKHDEIIALIITCIPMSAAFQYKYLIFICIIIYLVKFGKNIRCSSAIFPILWMIVWELFHGLLYPFSIYEFLRSFPELIFCTLLMMIIPENLNYKMVCRLLAISSICMMSIVFLNLLEKTGYDFVSIFSGSYRFGIGNTDVTNFGVNYNANALGMISNISIAGLLQLVTSKKHNIFDFFLMFFLIMFGVMTMSRSFLLCLVLIIVMFAISGELPFKKKIKRVFLIFILILLFTFLVYTLMPTVYESFVARFEVEDISNGRIDLNNFYLFHIFSSPAYLFFGVGIQDYSAIINAIHGTSVDVCHNGTLELVVCWGLPGLVCFGWFIYEMIRNKPYGLKRNVTNYIPLFMVLIYSQSGQLITSSIIMLSLCFSYISLCNDFSEGCKQ